MAQPKTVEKDWVVFDAKDVVLGRLASAIAMRLRGKHKPTFTPHVDSGDHVVVVNARHVHLTGKKAEQDMFYWHTGHPGGIKERSKGEILASRFPERVLEKAVERMMAKTKLGAAQMKHLRVYANAEHPHEAQKPTAVAFGAEQNPKNVKRG
jgi:large subunit ribosomal protein L13